MIAQRKVLREPTEPVAERLGSEYGADAPCCSSLSIRMNASGTDADKLVAAGQFEESRRSRLSR
jgi:hypothetical protein